MINPEFRRNLWLSFSLHKLIAMPALLGLVFLAVMLSVWIFQGLYSAATMLFAAIVWMWGGRNANLSIVDELRDKTWDQQRMSALGPWEMTWGKLFGATAYNWYGGLFCLAFAIPAGMAEDKWDWIVTLPTLIATAVMVHASLIAVNLHSAQMEMRLIQRGGLGWAALLFTLIFAEIVSNILQDNTFISWWGTDIPYGMFVLGSTMLGAFCAVFSAWRVMANALAVRTLPWAWPLFALVLTLYITGFSDGATAYPVYLPVHIGVLVALVMSYAALFTEPVRLPDWNRLMLRLQRRDWRGWLQHLPLWPVSLALAALLAVLASLPLGAHAQGNQFWHLGMQDRLLESPLALVLMLVRDAAIVLFFSFAPRPRLPFAAAALYIAALNWLLPFFFSVAGLHALSYFFFPDHGHYGAHTSVLVMATQAAIAISLLVWRLRRASQKAAA